ncbi:MAG: GH1 family beta-glucosidase [Micrococcales bacterium]
MFSKDFNWGVATSSFQIEGATKVDGRGESIWDRFCATPGKVANMENGDVACEHYTRYPQDVELMKEIGVNSYRFSLAWPRMFPVGDQQREQRGFDFYNKLIDELLEAGIQPLATLYHWDLPQTLQDKGGWANRDTVYAFADYAAAAVEAFSDRVQNWVTLNEPWCVTWLGYMSGVHAPGVKSLDDAVAAAHHTALAHAEASRAMKAVNPSIRTGIALNMTNYIVEDPQNAEIVELADLMDAEINRWWLDASIHGRYPQNLVDFFGDKLGKVVLAGDMDLVKVDSDFLGINYYADSFVGVPRAEDRPANDGGPFPFPHRSNGTPPEPLTDMGWPITPDGIKDLVLRVKRDWPEVTDIAITENGAAYPEGPDENGEVNDDRRCSYLESHIQALGEAIDLGAPVKSYYAWSLMDNFEWAEGYDKRFGLIHVDFETQTRTLKNSAKLYSRIIANQGAAVSTK